jgi:hypothetical protein
MTDELEQVHLAAMTIAGLMVKRVEAKRRAKKATEAYNERLHDWPEWQQADGARDQFRAEHGKELDEIKALPVGGIAFDDCILFMWATFPKMQEALDLMAAWGFTYKTNSFRWIKENKNADSLYTPTHLLRDHCLTSLNLPL